jgi:hypothetical protein
VFFYSADCGEPAHMHVRRDDALAKIWLHDMAIADQVGFPARELSKVVDVVRAKRSHLQEVWNAYCSGT